MDASEIISLAALGASILITGVNIWWQGHQEEKRAARTSAERQAEREANRIDRLHEHWLDTKITVYRQLLSSVSDGQARIADVVHKTPAGQSAFVHVQDVIEAAQEALSELELVAPKDTAEAASALLRTATYSLAGLHLKYKEASDSGDRVLMDSVTHEFLVNDAETTKARTLFRDRVRKELGLDVYVAAAQEDLKLRDPHRHTQP